MDSKLQKLLEKNGLTSDKRVPQEPADTTAVAELLAQQILNVLKGDEAQ